MLAESNRHINDGRISFDEANHDYFVDGKKIKFSVTEIIDKYYAEVQDMGGKRWDTSSLIKRFRK